MHAAQWCWRKCLIFRKKKIKIFWNWRTVDNIFSSLEKKLFSVDFHVFQERTFFKSKFRHCFKQYFLHKYVCLNQASIVIRTHVGAYKLISAVSDISHKHKWASRLLSYSMYTVNNGNKMGESGWENCFSTTIAITTHSFYLNKSIICLQQSSLNNYLFQ